jgi:probable rRNA maturation factor
MSRRTRTIVTLKLERQLAQPGLAAPGREQMQGWAEAALAAAGQQGETLTVRVTDEAEISALNQRYRGKQGATNVLSFPFDGPADIDTGFLGDLAICAPVIEREAGQQDKSVTAHWAHMIVHGVLHLCGYDHMEDAEAQRMEALETEIMGTLGFSDPYYADDRE